MKNIFRLLLCLVISFLSLSIKAQEKLSSYPCSTTGENYDVKISLKGSGLFSIWIDACSYDQNYPVGGLVIREKNFYSFIDAIQVARNKYSLYIDKKAKNANVVDYKSLNIYNKVDVFYRTSTWNMGYNVPLSFEIVNSKKDGKRSPILKITADMKITPDVLVTTDMIHPVSNPKIPLNGYGLIFTSVEEVDRFLEAISPEKVNSYVKLNSVNGVVLSEDITQDKPNAFLTRIDYGIKFNGDVPFGKYSSGSDFGQAYSLETASISSIDKCDIGGYVRLNFKKWYVQPELFYMVGNAVYYLDFYEGHQQHVQTNKTVSLGMLHLPLKVGYTLTGKAKTKLRFFVGPDFKMNCGSGVKYTYFHTLNTTLSLSDFVDDIMPVSISALGGIGIDFWRFSLDVQYNCGRNMFRTSLNSHLIDRDLLTQDIQIGLGVNFN